MGLAVLTWLGEGRECIGVTLRPSTNCWDLSDKDQEEFHHCFHHQVFPGESRISMNYFNRVYQGNSWKEVACKLEDQWSIHYLEYIMYNRKYFIHMWFLFFLLLCRGNSGHRFHTVQGRIGKSDVLIDFWFCRSEYFFSPVSYMRVTWM